MVNNSQDKAAQVGEEGVVVGMGAEGVDGDGFEAVDPWGAPVVSPKQPRRKRFAPTGVAFLEERAVLEAGSPKPFRGRPDWKYPDLDTQDHLHTPRFLIREWGWDVFQGSAYYQLWAVEAQRSAQRADWKKGKK